MINDYKEVKECVYKDEHYSVRDNGAIFRHRREDRKMRIDDERWTFQIKETLPIETISFDRVIRYLNVVYDIAKSIDSYLLEHHIGEFQTILAYHHLQPSLDMNKHRSERAMAFKKYYGAIDLNISKSFCKELVDYYESIK